MNKVLWHYGSIVKHKLWVAFYLFKIINSLLKRAILHDMSKFRWVETKGFSKVIHLIDKIEYGTEEYKTMLFSIETPLQEHYFSNPHHPQFYCNGIAGMTLVDILEMLVDWKASTRRSKNGNIESSLKKNKERFGIDEQLYKILNQTITKEGLL